MIRSFSLAVLLGALCVPVAAAEPQPDGVVHEEVAWVVAYEMPPHDCTPPRMRRTSETSTQIGKFQRQAKRYVNCVGKYQEQLYADFRRIGAAGDRGVTEAQAHMIMEQMRSIAATIKSFGDITLVAVDEKEMERFGALGPRPGL